MIWIWMLLAAVAGAKDVGPSADAEDLQVVQADLDTVTLPRKRRVHLPPIRFETRAAVREEVGAAAVFELGVQVARTRKGALDLNLAYAAPRGIRVPGPFRTYFA